MLESVLDGSYIGLVTSTPSDTASGDEVTASEYARQPWTVSYTQGDPTEATNTAEVEFPQATSSWGEVTHAVLFSAATGGTFLAYMELRDPNDIETPLPRTITSGDALRFSAGALVFEIQ